MKQKKSGDFLIILPLQAEKNGGDGTLGGFGNLCGRCKKICTFVLKILHDYAE